MYITNSDNNDINHNNCDNVDKKRQNKLVCVKLKKITRQKIREHRN